MMVLKIIQYFRQYQTLSDESIKPSSTSNKVLNPLLNYVGTKVRLKFRGDCLKQERISFDHEKNSKYLHC